MEKSSVSKHHKKQLHVHKNVDIHISIFILLTPCSSGAPFFTNSCVDVVWHGGAAEVLTSHRLLWWQPSTYLYCWVWQVRSSTWQLPLDSSSAFSLWGDGSVKCSRISGETACPVRLDAVTLDLIQHQQTTQRPKSSLTVETSHWASGKLDSLLLWDLDFQIIWKKLLWSNKRT